MSPLGMNVRTWVGTMSEAGIDCDAGQGPDYIPRWNVCKPSQFPASVGWIQGDAEDATFKRPESDALANGVVMRACRSLPAEVPPAWSKGLFALQCDLDVSLFVLHKSFA